MSTTEETGALLYNNIYASMFLFMGALSTKNYKIIFKWYINLNNYF